MRKTSAAGILLVLGIVLASGALPGSAGADEADKIVAKQVEKIQQSPPVGVLSLSFVVLLWSSSSLFVSVMDATNAAYGVRDGRPWWKRRQRGHNLGKFGTE